MGQHEQLRPIRFEKRFGKYVAILQDTSGVGAEVGRDVFAADRDRIETRLRNLKKAGAAPYGERGAPS